ncbi:MAG: hypothetical protein AAF585_23065, partial [Verrucomicrobiota bacterium]
AGWGMKVFATSVLVVLVGFAAAEIRDSEIRVNRIKQAKALAGPKDASAEGLRTALDWLRPLDRHDPEVAALTQKWTSDYVDRLTQLMLFQYASGQYSVAIELASEIARPSLDPNNIQVQQLLEEFLERDLFLRPHQARRVDWVRAVMAMKYEDDVAYLYRLHGGFGDAGNRRFGEVFRESIPEAPEHPNVKAIREKLEATIVPEVRFNDTLLADAIEFLKKQAAGVEIRLNPNEETYAEASAASSLGSDNLLGAVELREIPLSRTLVSLKLSRVSLADALRYTTDLARARYQIEETGDIVVIRLGELEEPLADGVYRVPPSLAQRISCRFRRVQNPVNDPFASMMSETSYIGFSTAEKYLESMGIQIAREGTVSFDSRVHLLRVRSSNPNLHLVDSLIRSESGYLDHAGPFGDPAEATRNPEKYGVKRAVISAPTEFETAEEESEKYLAEKLQAIRLPRFDFESLPLSQAIELLRVKSIDHDAFEPMSELKGVNMIIRANPDDDFVEDETILTGSVLEDVTLQEALDSVLTEAHLKMRIEPHAVVIVSLTEEPRDLETRIFQVPPNFLNVTLTTEAEANLRKRWPDRKPKGRSLLSDSGVEFPVGASAIYDSSNNRLIVRNLRRELDYLDDWVEEIRIEGGKEYRTPILGPWEFGLEYPVPDDD